MNSFKSLLSLALVTSALCLLLCGAACFVVALSFISFPATVAGVACFFGMFVPMAAESYLW